MQATISTRTCQISILDVPKWHIYIRLQHRLGRPRAMKHAQPRKQNAGASSSNADRGTVMYPTESSKDLTPPRLHALSAKYAERPLHEKGYLDSGFTKYQLWGIGVLPCRSRLRSGHNLG